MTRDVASTSAFDTTTTSSSDSNGCVVKARGAIDDADLPGREIVISCKAVENDSLELNSNTTSKNVEFTPSISEAASLLSSSPPSPPSYTDTPKPTRQPSLSLPECSQSERQKVMLCMCLFQMAEVFGHSMIPPFFIFQIKNHHPGQESHHMSVLFFIESMAQLIASYILSTHTSSITPKGLAILGLSLLGLGMLFLAIVDLPEISTLLFDRFSNLAGLLIGSGNAGFMTAHFIYLRTVFPDQISATTSKLEVFSGLGIIAGPIIAYILKRMNHSNGVVFMVGSGFTFLCALLIWRILPQLYDARDEATETARDRANTITAKEVKKPTDWLATMKLLKNPALFVAAVVCLLSTASYDFMDTLVSVHLTKNWEFSELGTSFNQVVNGIVYACASWAIGRLPENQSRYVMTYSMWALSGAIFMTGYGADYLRELVGSDHKTVLDTLIIASFSMLSATSVAAMIPTFYEMTRAAENARSTHGMSQLELFGFVSGIWNMTYAFALTVGSLLANILTRIFGEYQNVSLAYSAIIFIATFVIYIFYVCDDNGFITENEAKSTQTRRITPV